MAHTTDPIHIIINPKSGYGSQKLRLAEFRHRLQRQGRGYVAYVTKGPGDATRYVETLTDPCSLIVVWGGDGTVNEVAWGLIQSGQSTPILPVRAGTENLLAKELHIPRDTDELFALLDSGHVMHYDIGLINDRSFHSIAGVGFDAEVVHRVTQDRTGHISHLSYAWPIWRTFWEHRFPRFHIFVDGEDVFDGSGMAFVGNISRYATGLRICPDARFDDGLLDLAIFPCQDRKGLLIHSLRTALQRPARTGPNAAIYRQAKQIRIETDTPLPTQLDGDVGPDTPLEIRLAEHGIGVLVPASRADQLTQPQRGETST